MSEETTRSTRTSDQRPAKHGWRRFFRNLRQSAIEQARIFWRSKMAVAGLVILLFYLVMAIVAPYIVPYQPYERIYADDGTWADLQPPSADNPLGTTEAAHDVLT